MSNLTFSNKNNRYSKLKVLIYTVKKEEGKISSIQEEHTPLLGSHRNNDKNLFIQTLDRNLAKIIQFYTEKECEVNVELDHILTPSYSFLKQPVIIVQQEDFLSVPQSSSATINIGDDRSSSTSITMTYQKDNQQQMLIGGITTQRLIDLYIYLSRLKSFVSLNLSAFTKILKKYDKIMGTRQSQAYMFQNVLPAYPFQDRTRDHLDDLILQVEQMYVANNKNNKCTDLNGFLFEKTDIGRNIVWKTRLEQVRKLNSIMLGKPILERSKLYTVVKAFISLTIFICLLNAPLFEHVEQSRCFAILVFASVLWATEVRS